MNHRNHDQQFDSFDEYLIRVDEGIAAHEQGLRSDMNPYLPNTDHSAWWLDGFNFSLNRSLNLSLAS